MWLEPFNLIFDINLCPLELKKKKNIKRNNTLHLAAQ